MVSSPSRLTVSTGGSVHSKIAKFDERSPRTPRVATEELTDQQSLKERFKQTNGPVNRRFNEMKSLQSPVMTVSQVSGIQSSNNAQKAADILQRNRASPLVLGRTRLKSAYSRQHSDTREDQETKSGRDHFEISEREGSASKQRTQPTSPAKMWSQSQLDTNIESYRMRHADHSVDRTIGVGEGAGWFSPTNGSQESEDNDIDQQPQVMSVPEMPPPPPPRQTRQTKLARYRNLTRSQTPTSMTSNIVLTSNDNNRELKNGLDAASVVLQEEKSQTEGSGSSRSSLSHDQLKDVATRALQLSRIKVQTYPQGPYGNNLSREAETATHTDNPLQQPKPSSERIDTKEAQSDAKQASPALVTSEFKAPKGRDSNLNASTAQFQRRVSRSERFAALKRRAELKLNDNNAISRSLSSGSAHQYIHPAYSYSNRYMAAPTSSERSNDSGRGGDAPSFEPDAGETLGNEGETKSSRTAALQTTQTVRQNPVNENDGSLQFPGAKHEPPFELQHTPEGSATVVPTFDGHNTESPPNGSNFKAPEQAKGTVFQAFETNSQNPANAHYDSWLIDTDGSTSDESNMAERENIEPQRQLENFEHGLSSSVWDHFNSKSKETRSTNSVDGMSDLEQSKLLGEALADDVNSELSEAQASSMDNSGASTSLLNLGVVSKHDDGLESVMEEDEQYTVVRKQKSSSQRSDKSSRRLSDTRSDTSTESQSHKDPLRWWQQNYGRDTPGDTDAIVNRALETIPPTKLARDKYNRDDDIFEGLEEDAPEQPTLIADYEANSNETSLVTEKESTSEPTQSTHSEASQAQKEENSTCTDVTENEEEASRGNSSPDISNKSAGFKETRETLVDALDDNGPIRDRSLQDKDSAQQSVTENDPEPLLFSIGNAFVDSIQNLCRVDLSHHLSFAERDDELSCLKRQYAAAADDEVSHAVESQAEQSHDALENERFWNCAFDYNEESVAPLYDDESGVNSEDFMSQPSEGQESQSESAFVDQHNSIAESKRKAQMELLGHVDKAVALYRDTKKSENPIMHNDDTIELEAATDSVPNAYATLPGEKTTNANTASEKSELLSQFGDTMRKEGLEVLKLDRRNKWQYRVLTVSHETMCIATQSDGPDNASICPKALLWLKTFTGKPAGLSSIKKNGRGGLCFTCLQKAELLPESTNLPSIPSRYVGKFASLHGVLLTYNHEDEADRVLKLTFKSKKDAESFVSTLLTVKDVIASESRP